MRKLRNTILTTAIAVLGGGVTLACATGGQSGSSDLERIELSEISALAVYAKYIGFGQMGEIIINVTDIEKRNNVIELRLCDSVIYLDNYVALEISKVGDIGIKTSDDYCHSGSIEISYEFYNSDSTFGVVALRYGSWRLTDLTVY